MKFEPEFIQIQDVCSQICSGGTPSTSNKAFYLDGSIPWIKTKEVNNNKIFDAENYITEDALAKSSAKLIPQNSVIIAMYGNGDTAGRVAINKIPVATNQACCNLIVDPRKADYRFVFYYLRTQYKKLVELKNGGAQQNLNSKLLKEYPFPNKPLISQIEIANFLEQIDDKILLNNQTNQTLEQMAQAIFKSWFVDFDPVKAKMNGEPPEGMDEATAALFPDKLVESELGLIPEGWNIQPLSDVSRVINGRAYKNSEFREKGTPIVRIQNLTGAGKTVYSDIDLPQDKLIDHGDLIFAWSATFGPYLWRGPKSIYHYHIWKMEVDENKFGKYLLFMHLARLTEYLKNQGTGSIFTHLTKGIMESQKLVVPFEGVVQAFAKVVTPLFVQIDALHKQNKTLESLREILLPKLLSGELELEQTEELTEVS